MPILKWSSLFLAFISLCIAASAQRQIAASADARQTVGIAFSGGSALGLAHIGVIRYFEERHIPIDDVAGTSMGGLIGGLYATGMDSSQITEVVKHADWNALLNPSPPFADQPIVDKQNWSRTFGDFTLRFGRGFSLPSGLNPGEALSLLLSRSTLAYSSVTDFDQLPTPFRCVATDLVSGDAIVLSKGSLPIAMRATMSLPGIFTPVKIGQMVLVDGGVLENIPVDEARKMGAQTVIAVAFEMPKPKPEQFKSLTDVLRQTVSLAIVKNEQRSLANADLVIAIDTKNFGATDYPRWKEIIDAGYNAAKAHASDLARFELSDAAWAAYVADRRSRMRPSERSGKILAVTSPSASFQKNAQAEIERKLDSRVVAEHELEKALTGIVSATAVPGAAYGWQQGEDGKGGYTVKFAERPNDQLLARFSALYSISPGEPSRFGLKMSTVTVMKNSYKARFLGTLNLGYDPGVRVEPYKPFGGSQYFIAPQFFVERMHFNQYRGPERLSDTRDRFGGAFYAGVGTWQSAQVRIGAEAGYDSYSHSKVVDGVTSRSGGYASPALRWNFNTQDSGGMPTRGIQAEGAAGYTFRKTGEFPFLQHDFSSFFPVDRHFTLFAVNRAETSFGRKLGYFDQFMSGEQKSMSAFRYQAFHANTLVTAGPGVILHGPPIPYLSARPGLFFWYEAGRFDLGSSGWATHQSSSFGLIFPTQLGATAVQLSFDENGKARFRLSVGSF